jgi:SAM-dependent methyltransferase
VPWLFALAVFANAALLFSVQPMVAKMVLPVLGGTPAVWNTCMVFFQAALLAGYASAHALSMRLALRAQIACVVTVQLAVFTALPIALRDHLLVSAPTEVNPIPWLLGALLVMTGLPFFAVAMTGPLLQKWFSLTDHPSAIDPYFLYASSNFGSMLALVSYPLMLEPRFSLAEQAAWWSAAFAAVVLMTFCCGLAAIRRRSVPVEATVPTDENQAITMRRRLHWVALAFAPSSLLLGVTTYLSTDIATIPLLWIVPLSLYLLTFIMAFSRYAIVPRRWVARAVPAAAIVLTILLLSDSMQPPVGLWVVLHLAVFVILALFCHGELAADRPAPAHLTEFYLWLAVGGVLGGVFNALVAPLLFPRIWEYPLAVVFCCLLRRAADPSDSAARVWRDWLLPAVLGSVVVALILVVRDTGLKYNQIKVGLMFGLPCLWCYTFVDRPRRFALGLAAVFLASLFVDADPRGSPLVSERSFFGVLRVTAEREHPGRFYQLVHGNTFHGRQNQNPDGRPVPLSYYHPTGPIGQVFARMQPNWTNARVGVIGLGVGAMAYYAEPGQDWTFYEIDPAVKRIAENTDYFRFLGTTLAGRCEVVLGDARLRLRDAPDGAFDVLVLDAFSSDAVPVHLLTREAVDLYLRKLKPDGVLALHISNRYLDLKPVVKALAEDASLYARYQDDFTVDPGDVGKDPSQWVLMVRDKNDLGPLAKSSRWLLFDDVAPTRVWTDDYSNILSIVRWRESRD